MSKPLTQFAAQVQLIAQEQVDQHVSRQFVEHMVIVGLLDVEGCPRCQAEDVVAQVKRAVRLGVWEQAA
jgi:hypothetical protein